MPLPPLDSNLLTFTPNPSSIIPGGQVGAAALKDLQTAANGNSYTWITDVVGGTYLTFKLVDKDGNIAYSAPLTVSRLSLA